MRSHFRWRQPCGAPGIPDSRPKAVNSGVGDFAGTHELRAYTRFEFKVGERRERGGPGGEADQGERIAGSPFRSAMTLNPHRSPACRQIKPHLQVNVEVFAPYPSFKPGSMWVSRIFPPHSAQVARGTAG